jgi:hypothetical protein
MNDKEKGVLIKVHDYLGELIRDNLVEDTPKASDLADDVWDILHKENVFSNMTFGQAIEAMKRGKKVARAGWNGKGMYLWLLPAANVKAEWCKEEHLKALAEQNGGEIECLGSIRMKTADNKVLTGWLASQSDMLYDDWVIVD